MTAAGNGLLCDAAPSRELLVLRKRSEWPQAVTNLVALAERHGDTARTAAHAYGEVYAGRRGAMVFDVIASRQRNYLGRVRSMVARWEASATAPTLAALATETLDAKTFGLQTAEPDTMQRVATNLLGLSDDGLSEDDVCKMWAQSVQGLEHAHKLDPVVGGVSGVGPALFAYMRMRCGADALKPDVRVISALRGLGFVLPGDEHSTLVVARAAAAEIGFDLLTLDQLLWARLE